MEISTMTFSLSRPPPSQLTFSSFRSNFITNSNTISLLNKTKSQSKSVFVVGQPRRRTRAEPAKKGFTCNALFGLGVPELVVIAGVATLLFGPSKLPEVGRSIGKTFKSFQQFVQSCHANYQKAAKEFESELKKDSESLTEQSEENPTAISKEKKKPDIEFSSSKESV